MPQFGEYETIEQISVVEEPGLVATVWKARKTGLPDGRLYSVKCYWPRRGRITTGQPDETFQQDCALNFLEGIRQLKKAQHEGAGLVPVHAFGLTPEGAWFVTDYYRRGTLREYIDRKGDVDSATLRHVVYSVVAGCLTLKRSRGGKSHGNLKPSNVLLAGRPRPLKKTPLHLTDLHPAPLQLASLDTDARRAGGELPDKTLEVQDLRGVGELILQLVESRLLSNAYEYNYPVTRSIKWDALGKTGETWRGLCSRLLDPKLSVEQESLENLEREFRPIAVAKKVPMILAAFGAVIMFVLACYLGVSAFSRSLRVRRAQQEQKYRIAMSAGQSAFDRHDYPKAIEQAKVALRVRANDGPATKLSTDAQAQLDLARNAQAREEKYRAAMRDGQLAFDRKRQGECVLCSCAGGVKLEG